jgi:ankyrin repeat protein
MTEFNIPAHPSLEYDRKQARKLLKDIHAGSAQVVARLCKHHPRYQVPAEVVPSEVILTDVQLMIAREYGFSSWPAWKQYVEISALQGQERLEQFLTSVCSGNVGYASHLLRADDSFVREDLCAAAAAGDVASLRRRLRADRINVDQGPLKTTPLVYACQSRLLVTDPARRDSIVECARLLLEAGADPNRGFMRSPDDEPHMIQTAIYGAAGIANHPGLTRLLVEAGVKIEDGETLYHTAEFADTACLELILPDCGQSDIDYCLGRALDFERPQAALLMVQHNANVDYQVSWFNNWTHLMKAIAEHCDAGLIDAMIGRSSNLEKTDDQGLTAYRYAVRFGHETARSLLEARKVVTSQVSALDRFGQACMVGDETAAGAIAAASPEVVRDFDARLMEKAVRTDNHTALRLFVGNGVPVDTNSNMPPLHNACFWGHYETARLLVELGASLTHENEMGGAALGATVAGSVMCHDPRGGPKAQPPEAIPAGSYPAIIEMLIEAGAALPEKASGGPAVMEVLQRHGAGPA